MVTPAANPLETPPIAVAAMKDERSKSFVNTTAISRRMENPEKLKCGKAVQLGTMGRIIAADAFAWGLKKPTLLVTASVRKLKLRAGGLRI